ncbi:uncharacterized protein ACLA_085570 [Aspergillus clavatus NRRL 1]|uniref:Mtf2-like C-terminal domain-containing protein n=1 Tax=Aspergillus clavatus (strain ATCC 1007 / CBS 513.65 / DSM 816 / NCTC 3887 / NRRL 1 / QM 1276 / 107) TaxID=344612 RepID=A1CU74_ASPCL|nr:uncharacterized protein ACLA_085570 [Aspergillus clavatus NRRL 1]EAW06861.1 conserved hypothetical protein [Aspergillus clavatus NRRL 1]
MTTSVRLRIRNNPTLYAEPYKMSRRISRACLALATHTSPVPFLYQTRTLTALRCSIKWTHPRQCRSTSNTSSTPEQNLDESEEHPGKTEGSDGHTPSGTADSATQAQAPSDASPRVRKSYLQRRAAAAAAASSPSQPPAPSPRATSKPRSSTKPLTMTRTEKKAFSDLLEQLGVDESGAGALGTATATPTAPAGPQKPALSEEDRVEMTQVSAIFDSVLADIRKRKQRSARKAESAVAGASADGLAASATPGAETQRQQGQGEELGSDGVGTLGLRSDDPVSLERAIQLTVQRESAKIEAALRAAIDDGRGDVGIWDVCKERIFSLLQYLENNRVSESSSDPAATPAQSQSQSQSPSPSPSSPLDIPESVPVEAVVTALYPKVLLIAFQLLNSHFPGSPLISQFRLTIKSHGRTSAVLGSSTGLYNELVYFYWRGCNDLPSVVSLLEEMEVTGVEPDERTCGLLRAITEQRERDLRHHWKRVREENQGSRRDPWWDLAPNRKAVRELFGPDGWLQRLETRVQELAGRRDFL